MEYKDHIVPVPDFPRKGIVFRDLSPLYLSPELFAQMIADMAALVTPELAKYPEHNRYLVAAEARGFILGAALSHYLGLGFVPARRRGKLPRAHISQEYELEYGVDALTLHRDVFADDAVVVFYDDLLASGGTAAACCSLVRAAGAEVACCAFIAELTQLRGREKLPCVPVHSLVQY